MKDDPVGVLVDEVPQGGCLRRERGGDGAGHLAEGKRAQMPDGRTLPRQEALGGTPPRLTDLGQRIVGARQLAPDTVLEHQGRRALGVDLALSLDDRGDDVDGPLGKLRRYLRRTQLQPRSRPRRVQARQLGALLLEPVRALGDGRHPRGERDAARLPGIGEGVQRSELRGRREGPPGLLRALDQLFAQRSQILLDLRDLRTRRKPLVQGAQEGADVVRPPGDLGDGDRRRRVGRARGRRGRLGRLGLGLSMRRARDWRRSREHR
jgi:hypothetical protein